MWTSTPSTPTTTPPLPQPWPPDLAALRRSVLDAPRSIEPLVAEALAVVESEAFRVALAGTPLLAINANQGDEMSGAEVARVYLGGDPARPMLQATYAFAEEGECSVLCTTTAHTGLDAGGASICLEHVTVERATSSVLEERACAVNTIAHEWAHAVRDPGDPNQSLFKDDGQENAAKPLVSYTVGALAQCLYLREHGIAMEAKDLERCVAGIGVVTFNYGSCEAGWANQFKQ